jgi:hypothetical protein
MRIECGTRGGTHTARCGGTTQRPWSVTTLMTPLAA